MGNGRSRLALLPFLGVTAAVAALGSRSTMNGRSRWYRQLRKPPFNPPARIFAPVWTTLYAMMSLSAYRVWRRPPSPQRTRALAAWGVQLGLNGLWSPLFFGKHAIRTALADLGALALSIAAYIRLAAKVDRPAAALMVPYLGWVGFAGLLNGEIVRRNRPGS